RREGDHALAGIHPRADPVDKGNEDRDPTRDRAGVATKPLDDGRLALGDQGDGFHHDEGDESQQNYEEDHAGHVFTVSGLDLSRTEFGLFALLHASSRAINIETVNLFAPGETLGWVHRTSGPA